MTRLTPQRKAILEALRARRWHPTADEIFVEVRRKLPRISLGTVYRNLDLLSRERLIGMLDPPGEARRFDGVEASHTHVRCLRCGHVEDLSVGREISLSEMLRFVGADPIVRAKSAEDTGGAQRGFRITDHTLEFVGVCSGCATADDGGSIRASGGGRRRGMESEAERGRG